MGNTVVVIARILLGLIFVFFGAQGFVHFIPVPPIPGTAGAFLGAMETSHYVWFTSGVQLIAGLLLLANRYVPLAIVALGAVIANILVFHLTMMPSGLPLPIIVTVLWFVVALPLRSHFAPLFAQQVRTR
jgi:putative oxidoreductase